MSELELNIQGYWLVIEPPRKDGTFCMYIRGTIFFNISHEQAEQLHSFLGKHIEQLNKDKS